MDHCSCTVAVFLGTYPVRRRSLRSFKYTNSTSSVKSSQLGKKNSLCSYSVKLGRYERNSPCQRLQQKELQRTAVSPSAITSPFHGALPDCTSISPALAILRAPPCLLCLTRSPPSSEQPSPTSLFSTCHHLHTEPLSREHSASGKYGQILQTCPEKVALVSQLESHVSLVSLWCTNSSAFTRRTSRALTPLTLYLTTAWPTTRFAVLFRAINNVFVSLNRATTHLHLWLGFI